MENRVVLRYVGENPNGSTAAIAGITNDAGNVVGMMPHPERVIDSAVGNNRGAKVFESACSECHDLGEFTTGFMDSWDGATVYPLFESLRLSMPEDNPSSLKNREYVDVIAYLFSSNGLPAGDAEMESDDAALQEILIEGPFGSDGR